MLRALKKPGVAVLFALTMTMLATLLCWLLQRLVPAANLVLVYTAAVIITATSTRVRPALVSAFSGFLAFNFFFTEPRGSLLMTHREDVLTAALFLMIASLVGSLAGRLQGKVSSLEFKDAFSRIEHQLLERITTAMEARDILLALQSAIREFTGIPCHAARISKGGALEWANVSAPFPVTTVQEVERALLSGTNATLALDLALQHCSLRAVADSEGGSVAILQKGVLPDEQLQNLETIDILLRQASLGLRRIQLLKDLAKERIDKERELLRSSLLSSVSHDFRTPLTAMVGATTTLLEMRGDLTLAQQDELLESVISEAQRLDNYTQNLLDMTRLGQGELTLDRSWVSIEEIVNVVMKRVRPLASAHRLQVSLVPDIPLLHVHPALIEQAIVNVLHNALKFSPLDSLIELRCSRLDNMPQRSLLIEVVDEGPGIPESERENVFRLFHSAERGDRRAAGTGLGLAICKGMIGAHGGSVRISALASGPGCVVQMILPLTEPAQ